MRLAALFKNWNGVPMLAIHEGSKRLALYEADGALTPEDVENLRTAELDRIDAVVAARNEVA